MKKKKKAVLMASLISVCLCLASCGGEHETIRNNDNLGNILTGGAAGQGAKGETGQTENTAVTDTSVEALPDMAAPGDALDYYKLKMGGNSIPAGNYTIGKAIADSSITVYDAQGNSVFEDIIAKEGDNSKPSMKHAVAVEVPEGGSITVTAECIAQKH